MSKVITVGGPRPPALAPPPDLNLTSGEMTSFLGLLLGCGVLAYLIDGDPMALIGAAGVTAWVLYVNSFAPPNDRCR